MLTINKTIENGSAVFALEGRLDTVTAPELEKELKESLDGIAELTLDFEKLDRQGSMKLVRVGETIMEIFEVTGFSDILTIA